MIKKTGLGVSLIEILVAMIIISVGILSVTKLQKTLWQNGSLLQQQNQALALAQNKLEQLRGYEILDHESGKFAYADIVTGSESSSSSDTTYTINWTVTDNSNPFYKTVNLVVSWTDRQGTVQNTNITTIISRIDPLVSGSVFRNVE